ncbi:MAG: hypothetical protein JXQ83_09145, partial [Candidatus Glassbacteria bacterium]|nr:hypothetical protein [Candidatus Glassbacteria bacterium]
QAAKKMTASPGAGVCGPGMIGIFSRILINCLISLKIEIFPTLGLSVIQAKSFQPEGITPTILPIRL